MRFKLFSIVFLVQIILFPLRSSAQLKDNDHAEKSEAAPKKNPNPQPPVSKLPPAPKVVAPTENTPAGTKKATQVQPAVQKITEPEMIKIEGGQFTMGNNEATVFEKPAHQVTVSSFYMSKYEVTQQQWFQVMGAYPSEHANCNNCPVETVGWMEVQEFLKKLSKMTGKKYRLPTEAEWEYAAKGGANNNHTTFSGDNAFEKVGWCLENADHQTHPVGGKNPNELGLYDMCGNVAEWCDDWFSKEYYAKCPAENPRNDDPGTNNAKVIRGGDWTGSALKNCRNSGRNLAPTDTRQNYIGFRICR